MSTLKKWVNIRRVNEKRPFYQEADKMTTDYAKRKAQTGFSGTPMSSKPARSMPGWMWLVMGLVLGAGVAVGLYWKFGEAWMPKAPPTPVIISKNNAEPTPVEEPQGAERFDFYNLLPNLKMELPDVASPELSQPEQDIPAGNPTAFIIQAGSFKTLDQADQLKATLALGGVESKVQTVQVKPDETWYRIYIGPFNTKNEAMSMQRSLDQSMAQNSLILKIRV